MAKLIIARHGLSEDNVKRVISVGDSKPGLVEEGISQAHKLGEMLSDDYINKFSFIVSSSICGKCGIQSQDSYCISQDDV
jgi:broad specificity phosphatase PhoE